jgi:hypothetical protein
MPAAERQTNVDGWNALAGQFALLPVHVSTTSHGPADARHSVKIGLNAFAGHAPLVPVHVSAWSQMPAAERQTTVDGCTTSAGHVPLAPVHVSTTSQLPAALRHTVPLLSNWQAGEQQSPGSVLPSSHVSPTSTTWLPHTAAIAGAASSSATATSRPARMRWRDVADEVVREI